MMSCQNVIVSFWAWKGVAYWELNGEINQSNLSNIFCLTHSGSQKNCVVFGIYECDGWAQQFLHQHILNSFVKFCHRCLNSGEFFLIMVWIEYFYFGKLKLRIIGVTGQCKQWSTQNQFSVTKSVNFIR